MPDANKDNPVSAFLKLVEHGQHEGKISPEQAQAMLDGAASIIQNDPAFVIRSFDTSETVKHTHSYYTAEYGLGLKPALDDIIARGVAKEFRLTDFGTQSRNTVDAIIRQGWHWLMDNADPDKRYAKLRARCKICKAVTKVIVMPKYTDNIKSFDTSPDKKDVETIPVEILVNRIINWIEESRVGERLPKELQDISNIDDESLDQIKLALFEKNSVGENPEFFFSARNGILKIIHVDPTKKIVSE